MRHKVVVGAHCRDGTVPKYNNKDISKSVFGFWGPAKVYTKRGLSFWFFEGPRAAAAALMIYPLSRPQNPASHHQYTPFYNPGYELVYP